MVFSLPRVEDGAAGRCLGLREAGAIIREGTRREPVPALASGECKEQRAQGAESRDGDATPLGTVPGAWDELRRAQFQLLPLLNTQMAAGEATASPPPGSRAGLGSGHTPPLQGTQIRVQSLQSCTVLVQLISCYWERGLKAPVVVKC